MVLLPPRVGCTDPAVRWGRCTPTRALPYINFMDFGSNLSLLRVSHPCVCEIPQRGLLSR